MGQVLQGHDPEFDRMLAIKVLQARHCGDTNLTARFLQEEQITAQLQHPGIAPVHHRGRLPDGRPFFTMKLVRGQTLAELLARRKGFTDDLPRFLGIFGQVCQTLAYAHACGVIHRDLKPANIMVGAFGEVMVMDWGLAKVIGRYQSTKSSDGACQSIISKRPVDFDGRSQTGSVLGTPGYIAPEQARGEIDNLDERCDVFGLGAILCAILTGQPAHTGRSSNEILAVAMKGDLSEAHARLAARGTESMLVELALQCLTTEKQHRLRDARVVSEEMSQYFLGIKGRRRGADIARAAELAKAIERSNIEHEIKKAEQRGERKAAQNTARKAHRRRQSIRFLVGIVVFAMVFMLLFMFLTMILVCGSIR
jgi:serine/threonine-protein kinase